MDETSQEILTFFADLRGFGLDLPLLRLAPAVSGAMSSSESEGASGPESGSNSVSVRSLGPGSRGGKNLNQSSKNLGQNLVYEPLA